MRLLRNIIIFIVIIAAAVGVFIYALNEEGGTDISAGTVIINEFMASNGGFLIDDKGDSSDWIEIYNPTDQDINLNGLGLSDEKDSVAWAFPRVTLEAGGYLIVYASGENISSSDKALHTNFKLSASGGGVYMTNASGQVIGQVEYKQQVKDVSMGRDPETQEWTSFDQPTPGYENSAAGYEAFIASRVVTDAKLIITEVMPTNQTTIKDSGGNYNDYVEIYNLGSETVNLMGYGLSDNPEDVIKWTFPDVDIAPGAYLVVFASGGGESDHTELHADFRISAYAETVVLSTPTGLIMDQVTVSEVEADYAYARTLGADGAYSDAWEQTNQPTPGFSNNDEGFASYQSANQLALGPVVISEVMTSNVSYLQEADGQYYDWIEVCNTGDAAVDITGYSLTEDTGNPAKWRFPEKVLQPGEYAIVMASGMDGEEDADAKKNYIHTNFRLSAAGEVLALYDQDGVLADKYIIGDLPRGLSVGREAADTALYYYQEPTPGNANTSPSAGIVSVPTPNVAPGSYDAAQQVSLSCDTAGAEIYYTTDGTEPTKSAKRYTGAITFSETGMIRAKAFLNGYIDSAVTTATYLIGETHDLPVISLVTDPDNLWNEETGIYVLGPNPVLIENSTMHYEDANYLDDGKESERPASFEVFDESGSEVFAQDVAIRIQGGFSRDNQQKSLAVLARSQYGSGTMAYPFFEDLPFTEYESLVLKNGGQDQLYSKIKEAVISTMTRGKINCLVQNYKTYVVYLNGEYWGVYFLQEKRNEDFVAQHENVEDADSINVISGSGLSSGPNFIQNGTNEGYKELYNYMTTHDMSQKENFDYVAARLDTDSFMDLIINQIYVANSDYYNLQFYQIPDGKWKQIFYDFCWAFREPGHPTLEARMNPKNGGSSVFNALLDYAPWKEKFIERFAQTMEDVYAVDRFIGVIDEVAASVASEMPAERAKFTDTSGDWESRVEELRTFAKERPAHVLRQLKRVFNLSGSQFRSCFSLSDEQLMSAFNLSESQMQSIFE